MTRKSWQAPTLNLCPHAICGTEVHPRMRHDLLVRRMIRRLNAKQPIDELKVVLMDVLHEFQLGGARPHHEPFLRRFQRFNDMMEERLVFRSPMAG